VEAGLARRLASLVYEALLVTAILLIASFLLAPLVSPGHAASNALIVPSVTGRIVSFVALFVTLGVYFTWCWSEGRRTLPMKTWRIALVDRVGVPLSRRTAFVRYAAAWIGPLAAIAAYALLSPQSYGALAWPLFGLNWLASFVDQERQFLHDRIAGTRIVTA
jgi:uncharacterized RDD family membrane protein YckC